MIRLVMDRDVSITAEFAPVSGDGPPRFFLPWAAGRTRRVSQGNDGAYSHAGLYAWDFPMVRGTPVLAVGAGRVVEILESVVESEADSDPAAGPANFVTIDHGRGLQSFYAHLQYEGAIVEPGQWVARGQVIGYSGNTGYSTAPHLHYEVYALDGSSVSTGFYEVASEDGIPLEGETVTSANALSVGSLSGYVPSPLATDAFAINGIELTGTSPPALFYDRETDYVLTGRVLDGKRRVCAALVDPDTLETVLCDLTDVGADGAFTIPFRLPATFAGRYWFGIISGNDGAEGVAPVSIFVSAPVDPLERPVAVIEDPEDEWIDFGETGILLGGASFSATGRLLTYRWAQVSGPPALIADEEASDTTFTLEPGGGITRVTFQLVVFDGHAYSTPAEVEFFMPDTFHVSGIGVSDVPCHSVDTCPTFDPPPGLVSFSTEVLTGWVELVGAEPGDVLAFTILNPLGQTALTDDLIIQTDLSEVSFWQFAWPSLELELLPGLWTGVFERNGVVEAEVDFRVMP
jgi:murein DD-endopeptidase MepM/ murein hydrolase activator NlpD